MCRSRRELSNEYLLAKIGVDTAENEPLKVWRKIQFIIHSPPYWLHRSLHRLDSPLNRTLAVPLGLQSDLLAAGCTDTDCEIPRASGNQSFDEGRCPACLRDVVQRRLRVAAAAVSAPTKKHASGAQYREKSREYVRSRSYCCNRRNSRLLCQAHGSRNCVLSWHFSHPSSVFCEILSARMLRHI